MQQVPKSIQADNEPLIQAVHEEWQKLLENITFIEQSDCDKAEHIESACRLLWGLWDDEEKREVMGWESWESLFHPGNEELCKFFNLVEDRIVLNSPANQNRFYNLLLLDADPDFAERHILRERHWTRITQFESRISRAKALMREGLPREEKLKKFDEILAPVEHEKKDPEPMDGDFSLKGHYGYWRGKQALRLKEGDSPILQKLRARLSLVKVNFFLKKQDAKLLATNEERVTEVATVVLPPDDPDYNDLLQWLAARQNIKVVG